MAAAPADRLERASDMVWSHFPLNYGAAGFCQARVWLSSFFCLVGLAAVGIRTTRIDLTLLDGTMVVDQIGSKGEQRPFGWICGFLFVDRARLTALCI
jgi:hypothetical protein